MRLSTLAYIGAGLALLAFVVFLSGLERAQREGINGEVTVPSQWHAGKVIITEVETARLVCAVAVRGPEHAISCVPNMPGMFEEPGR